MLSANIGITVTRHSALTPPQVTVTTVSPRATAVILPSASTVAIASSPEVQVTVLSVASSGKISRTGVNVPPTVSVIASGFRVMLSTCVGMTVTLHVAVLPPQVAVIVASPTLIAVTRPLASTVAIASSSDDQVTVLSVAFSGRISGTKVTVPPAVSVTASGLMVKLSTGVGRTVTLHVAVIPPHVAVMVTSPTDTPVTTPFSSTVAISLSAELHVTILSVVFSGRMVAVSVTLSPTLIWALFSISRLSISTGLTFTVHVALASPHVAVTMTSPTDTPVTTPLSSTVAMAGSLELHVTVLYVVSSGFTVASKVTLSPTNISADSVLSVTLSAGVGITFTVHVALTVPQVTVIVASPRATPVTTPFWSIVAISLSAELHVKVLSVVYSGRTSAFRVTLSPTIISADSGLRMMLSAGVGITVTAQVPLAEPHWAVIVTSPALTAVTRPFSSTVATDSSLEYHCTNSRLSASSGSGMAVIVRVSLSIIVAASGSTLTPVTGIPTDT